MAEVSRDRQGPAGTCDTLPSTLHLPASPQRSSDSHLTLLDEVGQRKNSGLYVVGVRAGHRPATVGEVIGLGEPQVSRHRVLTPVGVKGKGTWARTGNCSSDTCPDSQEAQKLF